MVMNFFNPILDPIFSPLLKINPLFAIIIISFLIALLTTLAYKKFTDQSLMKDLKDEIKEFQKQMKELKNNPDKMLKVQKKAMDTNMKYMMHSFKPMIFTFIPIILIFGWLNTHMAYYPITEDQEFTLSVLFDENKNDLVLLKNLPTGVSLIKGDLNQQIADSKVEWILKAKEGEYVIDIEYKNELIEKKIIVTKDDSNRKYASPILLPRENQNLKKLEINSITVSNQKVKPLKDVPVVGGILGSIPWVGNFGWLGTYILFSIIFSISIRKLMKVY
jgi:uncharacterized membrane protein (DUF106 family)